MLELQAPEDWRRVRLRRLAEEVKERADGREIPVMSVTKHAGLVPSGDYFSRTVHSRDTSNYKVLRQGDFAYATIHLDEGSVDYLRSDVAKEGAVSPMYTVFRVNEEVVDHEFMKHLLRSGQALRLWQRIGRGSITRRKSIPFKTLGEVEIPLPPLIEQRKITAILYSVEEAIAATRTVIEQTKRVKLGLLQNLMTRGLGHTRFRDTEIGTIPEEWPIRRVDAFCGVASGSTPPRGNPEFFAGGNIPWVKTLDLNDRVISETDEKITLEALRETSCKLFPIGTVLCAMYGGFRQIGRTGVLGIPAATNQAIAAMSINPGEPILPAFLNYFFVAHRSRWRRIAASSRKDPNITQQDVCAFRVAVPCVDEQKEIVTHIDLVSVSIQAAEEYCAGLRSMKRGLMQDLLTGRVRVQPD